MQSCMQKNEKKKHEKWDCGSQVSLGDRVQGCCFKVLNGHKQVVFSIKKKNTLHWTQCDVE